MSSGTLKRILIGLGVLLGLQGIAVALWLSLRDDSAILLEEADGRRIELPNDRRVLLHFWATWCPPCREELPDLLALGRRLSQTGGPELWAVTLDRDWGVVRAFFKGPVPEAVVRATDGSLAQRYGVQTLPVTLLLAPDGKVLRRYDGAQRWDEGRFKPEELDQ